MHAYTNSTHLCTLDNLTLDLATLPSILSDLTSLPSTSDAVNNSTTSTDLSTPLTKNSRKRGRENGDEAILHRLRKGGRRETSKEYLQMKKITQPSNLPLPYVTFQNHQRAIQNKNPAAILFEFEFPEGEYAFSSSPSSFYNFQMHIAVIIIVNDSNILHIHVVKISFPCHSKA